ncbi:WhiB family transcriptional regulator [Rhodococcus sp. D2-41]|uniref:WhiB family transcriptional regulator n=1 Tax=Speluncibacter jeojiensis TaxID=2710754 RepID=UPI003853F238|nr:WhiB family transcriptional regulator [Rhodococcus sp. D2-41]
MSGVGRYFHFFSPVGETRRARYRREARAKAVCGSCPVLRECRRHALTVHEPYGVRGGLTEGERQRAHDWAATA